MGWKPVAAFGGLALLLQPLFFVIYRMSVFGTVPRDDYAWFLLWLVGRPGGWVPDSPYCYRLLSMVAAAPFTLLPVLPLSHTPAGLPADYLRATAALSAVSFLSWIGTAVLGFVAARQARLGVAEGLAAGALGFGLTFQVQVTAIDPLAVMLVAAGVVLVRRPVPFGALLLVSVGVNEKVALVLAAWLVLRCLVGRGEMRLQAALAAAAVGLYGAMVLLLHLPGNAYQRSAGAVPETVAANLLAYGSGRGLLLNALPLLVLLGLALAGRPVGVFRRADWLVVPALAGVALVLTQFFQAGRIAMHAAPIFVVPAGAALVGWLRGDGAGGSIAPADGKEPS